MLQIDSSYKLAMYRMSEIQREADLRRLAREVRSANRPSISVKAAPRPAYLDRPTSGTVSVRAGSLWGRLALGHRGASAGF